MFQGEIIHISTGPTRNHILAAVAATLASILIHVGFMLYLPRLEFDLPFVRRDVRAEADFRGLHLREVYPGEKRPQDRTISSREMDETRLELARVVEDLGLVPEEVLLEPPAVTEEVFAADKDPVIDVSPVAQAEIWEPRQEILAMDRARATAPLLESGRATIPEVERVVRAADIVIPVETQRARAPEEAVRQLSADASPPPVADLDAMQSAMGGERLTMPEPVVIGEPAAERSGDVLTEAPSEVTEYRAIEDVLRARVTTYTTLRDFRYGYFRIEIERVGPALLPVIPKDLVLVQDCSASMSEQRLYFCRQALQRSLESMGPQDRFNLVAFRDRTVFCFPEWAPNTPQARSRAAAFIEGLSAAGNTDIYGSLQALMQLERTPGRPVIAALISDGLPTEGLTDSADIIGEFTRINDGRISVFSIGMPMTANRYLLDLLSYCNRGDASIVPGGRWGIPEHVQQRIQSVERPVLSDVRFRFADQDEVDVYPKLTSNLYLDKSLFLYGRYPRGRKDVVFQAIGQALGVECDMIFSLVLDDATRTKDGELREMWARQRLYHLQGEYARTPTEEIREQIRDTARAYRVRIPHRGRL